MTQDPSMYIGSGLKLLKEGLSPFVEKRLESRFGYLWQERVKERFPDSEYFQNLGSRALDSYGILKIMKAFWGQAFADLGSPILADVRDTLSVRNQHAHDENFNRIEADVALTAMARLLDEVGQRDNRTQKFAEEIKNLCKEMNVELPSQPSPIKLHTGIPPTTDRPQMTPYLKKLVQEAKENGNYEQSLFDSELREMLKEAKQDGKQTAQIVSKKLCYRTIDEYVDGVMVMSSDAMWTVWERQGSRPERVMYRSKGGFSNLLEIEFDTNNPLPENRNA